MRSGLKTKQINSLDMLHKTKIGVCMDEGVAYLLEEKNDENVITIIEAEDFDDLNSESIKPAKRKRPQKDNPFIKKVFEIIKDFDKVSLFGPAQARNQLMSRIRAHKLLDIEIQNNPFVEDTLTEKQKIDFINRYFEETKINTA
jgi:hypothetical protein